MSQVEDDSMLTWIIALVVVTVVLVLLLEQEEQTKHLTVGYEKMNAEVSKQLTPKK